MTIRSDLRGDLVRLVLAVAVIVKALAFIQLSAISVQPVIANFAMFAAGVATATLGFLAWQHHKALKSRRKAEDEDVRGAISESL